MWWKVTIMFDAIALEVACWPVRVQTGEWKVIRVNQRIGFHHRENVDVQHFTICNYLIAYIFTLSPSQLG